MKKFPFLKQFESMDCGPTCLAMVCRYYGKTVAVQTLRDKTQIGKDGVNLLGISEAAESIGFRAIAVQLSYDQLVKEARLPCILHWKQNHFVVLWQIKHSKKWFGDRKKEEIFIADPAHGLRTLPGKAFKEAWLSSSLAEKETGIALLLEPGPDFKNLDIEENIVSPKAGLRSILKYALPYRNLFGQLILALGIAAILQMFLPFLTQSVVDTGINTQNLHFVYIVLAAQFALFFGRLVIEFLRSWILLHISTRINISILTDFLIKLMKLPAVFFDSKKTGDIMQRINDHHKIKTFLTGTSMNILFSGFSLISLSLVLAFFNSMVFLVFISASLLYVLWIIFFLKRRKQLDYQRFDISAKEQSATIQMVQGMQEIKLNGSEKAIRWKWEHIQAKLFKVSIKDLSLDQWQQSGAFFINEGKNILITFFSAKAVIDGYMSLGSMLAIQYIIGQLNSPIEQMIGFIHSWQDAKISMERLNEIHQMKDEEPAGETFLYDLPAAFSMPIINERSIAAKQNGKPLKHKTVDAENHGISFKEVSFTYEGAGNLPVIQNVSFNIPLGKTTAIVGISGSGKTTLLKLLLKFYQPQQGEIRVGGSPLGVISHKVWRRHCGVVMQDSFIFSDSIARNIAVGVERIDPVKLEYAMKVANMKDFVSSLPLGYHTNIGAEGNGISMGQRQRILLARAIYKDPGLMLLDEATNSLDAHNESVILANLNEFLKGKTVVVVAHRLSTVKHADRIIVLHRGRIAEQGTHRELIDLKANYFSLVKDQLELGD